MINRWLRQRLKAWRKKVGQLQQEINALYLGSKDPRVPWYAKALLVCILAYAFSPIDLIPDFIPVLGYLDDLLLLPLGIVLVLKMIPTQVLHECRAKAKAVRSRPVSWLTAGVILVLWLLGIACVTRLVMQLLA
ncbi:MAG: hypothetical protein BRC48_13895 [Cyanobacteria bacterium QS_9_48_30]|nr:MAG: hypothetical protein BRC48_13895 [Cyanobacteria bacterium QS_9_48_30]